MHNLERSAAFRVIAKMSIVGTQFCLTNLSARTILPVCFLRNTCFTMVIGLVWCTLAWHLPGRYLAHAVVFISP